MVSGEGLTLSCKKGENDMKWTCIYHGMTYDVYMVYGVSTAQEVEQVVEKIDPANFGYAFVWTTEGARVTIYID